MESGMIETDRAEWRVSVGSEETGAIFQAASPTNDIGAVFVCAHGAGGSMHDRGMTQTAETLVSKGFGVVRFNFLYKEKKSSRPDPMPRLKDQIGRASSRTRGR